MIFGVENHVLVIALVMGALVATTTKQMIPRKHIPLVEIYLKKGSLVWFVDANNRWWPYTVKNTRLGYFACYTDKIKGVFHINPRHVWYIGDTPCYTISVKDMNNYNPVDIGTVNKFLDANGIFKLRQKDIKHLEKLRTLRLKFGKKESNKMMEGISQKNETLMDEKIQEGLELNEKRIAEFNQAKQTNYNLDDVTNAAWLIDHILKNDLINQKEADILLFKLGNGMLDLASLKDELKEIAHVSVSETMDINIDRIVDDFGTQNPLEVTGVIDDVRDTRKGLKTLTPTPVKSFIPGGVILAIGIVIMFFVILISNGTISADLITGGGGFSLPGFGFLKTLLHIF